jgi:hypothetical protein
MGVRIRQVAPSGFIVVLACYLQLDQVDAQVCKTQVCWTVFAVFGPFVCSNVSQRFFTCVAQSLVLFGRDCYALKPPSSPPESTNYHFARNTMIALAVTSSTCPRSFKA